MQNCINCKSENTKKNGHGRYDSQRFFCWDCNSSFTIEGKRGTYSPEFKQQIIEEYCHQGHKAKEIIQKHKISSRSLIKWKKEHQTHCWCKNK